MRIRPKIAALCCCLLFFLPALASSETQVSPAVQPFADVVPGIKEVEPRAPSLSFFYHRASGSETLTYNYWLEYGSTPEKQAVSCTFTLRNAAGVLLYKETIEKSAKSRMVRFTADLDEGVYTITATEYNVFGQIIYTMEETFYFLTNASIVISPYPQSRGMTVATVHGKKQFDWYPVLDSDLKPISSRYRFRITADKIDNRKEDFKYFGERVIVDETMRERWHVIDADLLPPGTYTVKVWAYDDGGGELDCWQMTLVCQERWTIYDYDLVTDLDFTPGEAITRQHATGDKTATLVAYDAVLPETPALPMTKLSVGGETLDADCSGARFTAGIADGTLTLRASGAGAWRIRQSALRTLAKSGIRTIRFVSMDGETRELSTDLTFAGRPYALLRAKGLVSKDFLLVSEEDGWRVEADGSAYGMEADGTLTPRGEETEEEGAA